MRRLTFSAAACAALALAPGLAPRMAHADAAMTTVGKLAPLNTGKDVYQHVCQGCHMPDAKGAMGSGAQFPALAGDAKLASPGYPVYVIQHGYGAMPWFSGMLTDKQIADVVNYVRSNFGNHFKGTVTAKYVAAHDPHITMEGN